MKKLILSVSLFLSVSINGQIQIKESIKDSIVQQSGPMSMVYYKLVNFYKDSTSNYTFYFKNQRYQHITDIKYIDLGNERKDVKLFFEACLQVIESGEKLTINVGKETILLSKSSWTCTIWNNGAYVLLPKKEIIKIIEKL